MLTQLNGQSWMQWFTGPGSVDVVTYDLATGTVGGIVSPFSSYLSQVAQSMLSGIPAAQQSAALPGILSRLVAVSPVTDGTTLTVSVAGSVATMELTGAINTGATIAVVHSIQGGISNYGGAFSVIPSSPITNYPSVPLATRFNSVADIETLVSQFQYLESVIGPAPVVQGQASNAAAGGTITVNLWDVTAATQVATATISTPDPSPFSFLIPSPVDGHQYELRALKTLGIVGQAIVHTAYVKAQ